MAENLKLSATISVIIPCYNAARFLPETLAYLQASEGVDLQIVCVDDGSTDETFSILQAHSNQLICIQQENAGPSAARNAGLALATGDFIHFHDADDRVAPTFYQSMRDEFARRPEIDALVGHCRVITQEGVFIRDWLRVPHGDLERDSFHTLLKGALGPPIPLLARSEAVKAATGFDPLILCEDWDFFLQMAAAGARFGISDTCLSDYRISSGSGSSASNRMWRSAHYVIKKHENFHTDCEFCRLAAAKAKQDCDAAYAMLLFNVLRDWRNFAKLIRQMVEDVRYRPSLIQSFVKVAAQRIAGAGNKARRSR